MNERNNGKKSTTRMINKWEIVGRKIGAVIGHIVIATIFHFKEVREKNESIRTNCFIHSTGNWNNFLVLFFFAC